MSSYAVGQKIQLNDGRVARIKFVGTTAFQTGEWIGVELDEPTGKNDGSVKGERYFECQQGFGMFLRPSGVRSVIEDVSKQPAKRLATSSSKPRPSSVHAGVNGLKKADVSTSKRTSMVAASPTPGPRTSLLSDMRSPAKSPTKQLASNGAPSSVTSRTSTPSSSTARRPGVTTTAAKPRQSTVGSMGPPARPATSAPIRTSRPSVAATTRASQSNGGRATPLRTNTAQQTLKPTLVEETAPSETSSAQEESEEPGPLNFAPSQPPQIPPEPSPRARRGSSPPASVHSQRTVRSTAVSSRHVEELEAKVRLLERKRAEDRDVKKSLEQTQQERDKYQGIIERLQKKYQPQQQEIADLKKALAQAESKHTSVEDLQAEHESMIEMATLDKEMAEETADALRHELDALRSRQEEMEMEIEVLRDENAEFSKDMSPEERTSAGWLQLEKENDRLRNALLRLRDLTQDREQELKDDLSELRSQVASLEKMQTQFDDMKEKLLVSESTVIDLREQLEAAADADNIIEELTDRNMGLNERVGELRATIEDLENIKELNDELEINHIEAEKQLQEEIDFKDALLLDRDRAAKLQQSSLDDADYTITKFRELVVQLQSDLQDMQASKQISDIEASDLSSKSRAMMDLNMRLQTSAAKTQVKTIELELRKMDAEEASEHLAIVQLFLPDSFHAERDSVLALLRFKRISFKAGLLLTFVRERVSAFGSRGRDDAVFAGIDVINALTWIAEMADRFVKSICACSMTEFAKYETALYEIEPVERALNGHIDALRRDEIKEQVVAEELLRSIGVMSHLASIHINDSLASHADDLSARLQVLHSQLEGIALTFTSLGTLLNALLPATSEDEINELQLITKRGETLINHARGAKVIVGKTDRALNDLQERSLTLDSSCADMFEAAETQARLITAYSRRTGDAVQSLATDEGRLDAVTAADIVTVLSQAAVAAFDLPAPEAGPYSTVAQELRSLTDQLTALAALPNDLDNCVEFERGQAPWVARAEQIKQQKLSIQDTAGELARANELLRERETIVRAKDAELEEHAVRIETLEARMRDASKRSARIAELEEQVQKAVDAERRAKRELERSRGDSQAELRKVREELSHVNTHKRRSGGATIGADALGPGAQLAMKGKDHKITTLQSAVRFLQGENTRLRMPTINATKDAMQSAAWLFEPLIKPKTERQAHDALLQQQGRTILHDLLQLATSTPSVDLTNLPENKLAWRPAKASSRWQVEKRRESWEIWRSAVDKLIQDMPPPRSAELGPRTADSTGRAAEPRARGKSRTDRPMSVDIKVPGSLPMS